MAGLPEPQASLTGRTCPPPFHPVLDDGGHTGLGPAAADDQPVDALPRHRPCQIERGDATRIAFHDDGFLRGGRVPAKSPPPATRHRKRPTGRHDPSDGRGGLHRPPYRQDRRCAGPVSPAPVPPQEAGRSWRRPCRSRGRGSGGRSDAPPACRSEQARPVRAAGSAYGAWAHLLSGLRHQGVPSSARFRWVMAGSDGSAARKLCASPSATRSRAVRRSANACA